jgi:hypothetical protein
MTAWAHQGAAREPTDAKKFRPGAGENFHLRCGEITWSFVALPRTSIIFDADYGIWRDNSVVPLACSVGPVCP